ncbi:hypothetical protein FA13DRAFT_1688221 [Coprinellus micaceus]|uniref:Uncharacterized protein n=1 Tax=Coprinellus micaceus TaxID=71717 RepID=A0A4Y7TAR1_COPMI|nr:hypothetical protein FA13DRAFT_1688221 [Coprinellus micaceus]
MRLFHYEPSEILWQPDPSIAARRVHSELYNSDAFLRTHQELQDTPATPGCKLQRVVAGLMFWSDATHVSSFSDEKLWPGYMAFANESKYQRCRPSQNLYHHVAYFSDLPDELKDLVTSKTKKGNVPDKLMHFCKQEMLHAQWKIILNDDEFQDAVKNGIVLKCPDGDYRRFFIRIFTYSADYQEKVLIATIRGTNGLCPCSRCLVSQADLSKMGTAEDLVLREQTSRKDDDARLALVQTARGKLLGGLGLSNAAVDGPLKTQSLQPVSNAFSNPKMFASGVDIFSALVVDQMHEFEQGVWKDLFVHLLRVLVASGPGQSLAHVLDRRYGVTARSPDSLPNNSPHFRALLDSVWSPVLEEPFVDSRKMFPNRSGKRPGITRISYSAPSPFSMTYCQTRYIPQPSFRFWRFVPSGMHWRNSGCIRTIR